MASTKTRPAGVDELISLGIPRAHAARFLAEADQVTADATTPQEAKKRLNELMERHLDRWFGEPLVPPGFERT